MDIISEINILKEKINNEIESLSYYKELSYICDVLKKEINDYKYDENKEFSLRQYKAFLESFLDYKIGYINHLIVNKKNDSIFDNGEISDYNKLTELKESISKLLTYIENNFPIIGKEVAIEYEKINKKYENEFKNAEACFKKKFDREVGSRDDIILSIFGDTSSVIKSYINYLTAFKAVRVDKIKIFVDNDIKVKELFKRAYDTLKDERVIEAVKGLEHNYLTEIDKCVKNGGLSADTNILMIQNDMIKNGLKLDEIINREKLKNKNYEIISNMTLNYDNIDELLKLEAYVSDNEFIKEDFYKVLYVLVEKEKYLNLIHGVNPVIYNKISEKSKIILEKMFLEKIKELSDRDKEEIVINLKKNGYFNVMDNDCKAFFDNYKINIHTDYEKEVIENTDTLECVRVNKGFLEPHNDIINKETGKMIDQHFNVLGNVNKFERVGDIYIYTKEKHHPLDYCNRKLVYYYYDKDGYRFKPFKENLHITRKVLDCYIVGDIDQIIVDDDFNKIMDFNNSNMHKELLVDYSNKNIVVYDGYKGILSLYDKGFNLIKEIPIQEIIGSEFKKPAIALNEKINMFNDNVVSIYLVDNGKMYILYYDVINMKRIDLFEIQHESSLYGYSEELYPFNVDGKYEIGYKNIDGEVIIEPKYTLAYPFFGGIAQVMERFSVDRGFINRQGEHIANCNFLGSSTNIIVDANKTKKQYTALIISDSKKYTIIPTHNYTIECDDKIVDIDFNKDKVKVKTT